MPATARGCSGRHGCVEQSASSPPCQGGGRGFKSRHNRRTPPYPRSSVAERPLDWREAAGSFPAAGTQAPVVKRRSCRITDPVVKVRVLPGARTACSSSGRAPFSRNGGSRFDTCRADRCLDPESEGPGRDPGISGSVTRQAPPGRADHVARTPGRKPVASAVQVRLLPRPPQPPPAAAAHLPGSGFCRRASEARLSQFDSGQGGGTNYPVACPSG